MYFPKRASFAILKDPYFQRIKIMNIYKEIEKLTDFQLDRLKILLDQLPLFEIIEKSEHRLVVRQEAQNCVSMKELIKEWEMIEEKDGLITFLKKTERTYEETLYS